MGFAEEVSDGGGGGDGVYCGAVDSADSGGASVGVSVILAFITIFYSKAFHFREPDTAHGSSSSGHDHSPNEVVIPLVSDMAFFQMLSDAIEGLSAHLATVHSDFVDTLEGLSRTISNSARPTSSTTTFHPYSLVTSDAGAIRYPAHAAKVRFHTDLRTTLLLMGSYRVTYILGERFSSCTLRQRCLRVSVRRVEAKGRWMRANTG